MNKNETRTPQKTLVKNRFSQDVFIVNESLVKRTVKKKSNRKIA
jgi:hypothetical protein